MSNNGKPDAFRHRGVSVFSGEFDRYVPLSELPSDPIISAWLDDPNIVEITITSACIGFSHTFTKPYSGWTRPANTPDAEKEAAK